MGKTQDGNFSTESVPVIKTKWHKHFRQHIWMTYLLLTRLVLHIKAKFCKSSVREVAQSGLLSPVSVKCASRITQTHLSNKYLSSYYVRHSPMCREQSEALLFHCAFRRGKYVHIYINKYVDL